MIVLLETAAGYALFRLLDDNKLQQADSLATDFATPEGAKNVVKLKAFHKFENTVDALSAVTAIVEGKVAKNLKSFLTSSDVAKLLKKEQLIVSDQKLGSAISKKLGINVMSDSSVNELYRGIRSQLEAVLQGISPSDLHAMQLGLSHSLSRYKLKFSPDKVDTMIIQAIHLLDDLDKELNTYAMRLKEWYGWHFPEMAKIVVDNLAFARCVKLMKYRTNTIATDLSGVLPEEIETQLKEAAEISMGTEISEEDMLNIEALCDQVINIFEYRANLYEYLKNRMVAIAPNLTTLVGELVGARLIAHAGSLLTLSKYPASTVQILGAEKALFRALKTKHDTPKYGLIYHASLVGQAGPKMKGKIARTLATKTAIAIRVDALGESESPEVGIENRAKVEARLRQLEGRFAAAASGMGGRGKNGTKSFNQAGKHDYNVKATSYNAAADSTLPKKAAPVNGEDSEKASSKKRKHDESDDEEEAEEEPKKEKKEKKDKKDKSEKSDKKEKKEKKEKKSKDEDDSGEKKKKKKAKTEE
ncbi:Nop-domain-containing protein [Ramicandelaber brevisporus]|nr:Nop-domain-containing protein [Ramicandelaber brevisporus]KAI8873947.1 Nop-domain-containing protein [Ramicandelaber brevisporus]